MLLEDHFDEQTGSAGCSTTHIALDTSAAIGSHLPATKQGQQTFAARESTKVRRPRADLVREALS